MGPFKSSRRKLSGAYQADTSTSEPRPESAGGGGGASGGGAAASGGAASGGGAGAGAETGGRPTSEMTKAIFTA
ncbi:MAG: hypothetical protein FJX55_20045 [Alphaproteobacteria bacterium]|nr:hypothetical protein [Alphaproteobacteria bacterium]